MIFIGLYRFVRKGTVFPTDDALSQKKAVNLHTTKCEYEDSYILLCQQQH
ncbi:hypothetical protein HMPREF0658_0895 [Hoylesella marshii DSM 16973 = JCM 13450]|uniref:Uncharacterized protein n=1 Tax=Hoylesella marshii DSM 16973 = JCM 13450 TaxID=862515 RepID=E0NRU4_9BACT|nr:hypothetical protein HMPREF0658_0895 [Hoylesella marshii DSM 16973 = JCM 13450]